MVQLVVRRVIVLLRVRITQTTRSCTRQPAFPHQSPYAGLTVCIKPISSRLTYRQGILAGTASRRPTLLQKFI